MQNDFWETRRASEREPKRSALLHLPTNDDPPLCTSSTGSARGSSPSSAFLSQDLSIPPSSLARWPGMFPFSLLSGLRWTDALVLVLVVVGSLFVYRFHIAPSLTSYANLPGPEPVSYLWGNMQALISYVGPSLREGGGARTVPRRTRRALPARSFRFPPSPLPPRVASPSSRGGQDL